MNEIKKVHLYVESYNRQKQELLLDFVREDEFLYFRNRGDYLPSMHLTGGDYQPTMLLVYKCAPKRTIWHGALLTLDMNLFMELRERSISNISNQNVEYPATVFLEIQDGERLANLIDDSDYSSVSKFAPSEYSFLISPSWSGAPCALKNMDDCFEISVWNVGQGSTNCISDGNNLTIFDFGASLYYSYRQTKAIFDEHSTFINKHSTTSLIISHWDLDHYKMLCIVPDKFLQNLCCVFCPPQGIGMTLKQVIGRIEMNCDFINVIESKRQLARMCGITEEYSGNRYKLFVGEKNRNKNESGLLLSVFNETATAFLTADHSNYQIWNQMYALTKVGNRMIHIVVPHHGGDCGNAIIPRRNAPGIAVISVGSNNYGHPKKKTISLYRDAGYTVMQTDRCGHDIVIKM